MPVWRRLMRPGAIVFGLYLVLSLLLTFPLPLHFTTHVVGTNVDEGTFIWNLWWVKHAVVDLRISPLSTDLIFYPVGLSLVFYTLTLFNGLVAIPLLFFVSPITANNILLILSLALSAFGAFSLVRYLLQDHSETDDSSSPTAGRRWTDEQIVLAAAAGGLVYAFPASRFVYASLGQVNLTSTAWLPFFVLFFLRTVRSAREEREERHPATLLTVRGRFAWAWYGFWTGLFLLFSVATELTYGAFLILFASSYLLTMLLRRHWSWRGLGRLAGGLAIGSAVFVAGFLPVLLPVLQESGGFADGQWGGADQFSADLLSFVIPSRLHPLFGPAATKWSASLTDLPIVYVGFVVLLLALLGAWRFRRALAFWSVSALAYAVLCLGPVLHVNGVSQFDFDGLKVRFALPFILLHYLPLIKANRVPNRFSIMAALCLAVLVGFGLIWLLERIGRRGRPRMAVLVGEVGLTDSEQVRSLRKDRLKPQVLGTVTAAKVGARIQEAETLTGAYRAGANSPENPELVPNNHDSGPTSAPALPRRWVSTAIALVLAAALLFEHLSVPLPLTYAAPPDVYRQIGQEPGDFAILQLPLGWRNSYGIQGVEKTLLQSYQAAHGKRILGGNTSRSPESKFRYYAEVPLLQSIITLEEGRPLDSGAMERDRALAGDLLSFYDLRYLVVHRDLVDPAVERYLTAVLPVEKFSESGNVVAYRLSPAPHASSGTIDLGRPGAAMNRSQGWGRDESGAGDVTMNWAMSRDCELFLALPDTVETKLTLRVTPFAYAGMPEQSMAVAVNGQNLGTVALQATWQDYNFGAPASQLRPGLNRVTLHFAHLASPSKVMDSTDKRDLAAAVDYLRWEKAP